MPIRKLLESYFAVLTDGSQKARAEKWMAAFREHGQEARQFDWADLVRTDQGSGAFDLRSADERVNWGMFAAISNSRGVIVGVIDHKDQTLSAVLHLLTSGGSNVTVVEADDCFEFDAAAANNPHLAATHLGNEAALRNIIADACRKKSLAQLLAV